MYKTILRTLSAFSIVTITASAGFAEHPDHPLDLPCTDPANAHTEKCRAKAGIKPVTTDVWKDSFESDSVPLPADPNPTSRIDQFISPEASIDHYEREERVHLKFDINNDGTNTIVGTSIFYIAKNGNERNFYAGIRIGADLGAPITEAFPEAVWKTRFKAVGSYNLGVDFQVNEIFDLTVKFISNSADPEAMGEISGYIQHTGYYGFKIDAQFNNAGVITGTDGITYGRFQNAQAEPTNTVVGNLTGIIGERGTLGAFHSDGNSNSIIRGFAGGFRANGFSEDDVVALRSCTLDPFKEQCSADRFDDLKIARIELCIEGDNASDTNPIECHNAVLAEGCIRNPFQAKCTGDTSDFNQYSAVARTNRIAFCDSSANAKKPFCTVGTIVTDVCVDDPFHAICGDDYDEPRNTAVQTCLTTGVCTDRVLERPNAGTWANSFKTEGNPEGLDDAGGEELSYMEDDLANLEERFLKNIKSAQTNENIDIYYTSLNLKTTKFSIDGTATDLGGDEKDGMAHFSGSSNAIRSGDNPSSEFAGIFSTTDLGAPLTAPLDSEPKTASWVGYLNSDVFSQDFVLEVNFDTQSIEAFSRASYLKGDYDANGLISGTLVISFFAGNNRNKERARGRFYIVTGLIGKEGAVGAFVGTGNGGFVARPADLVVDETTGKNAETFLNETCAGNPFHDFCYLSDHRKTAIDLCITGKDVLNDDCKKAREHHSCLRHPFDEECKKSLAYHNDTMNKPYYEIARANRSVFCNVPANETDDFCMDAERVALCSYDPFHRLCDNTGGLYNDARKAVCKAGSSHADCATGAYRPPLKNKVTGISWLAGLYKDNGVILGTEPDTIRVRVLSGNGQFLKNIEDAQTNTGIDIYISPTDSSLFGYIDRTTYDSLNLNTATFDGLELGGDAADGVASFVVKPDGFRRYIEYTGIFSSTDLGAPLVEAPSEGKFYGQFRAIFQRGVTKDFTLDVDFSAENTGMVEAFVHQSGTRYYLLEGKFDSNGVISGTVKNGTFSNHDRIATSIYSTSVLTGLIGEEGAVGVFSGGGIFGGVFGGFVASSKSAADAFDPNVKISDWVRGFDNTPGLPYLLRDHGNEQTRFLIDGNTGFRSIQTLTLADDADGVAYVSREVGRDYNRFSRSYETTTVHHHAGILSGTNLGAALPTVPAGANGAITAIWDGKLGLIANQVEIPKRDIDLMVDFTNKRISHSSDVDGEHLVNFSATWKSGVGYDGVLKGDITYDATPTLHNGIYVANDNSKSDGTVTGLIGAEGVVGAFISDEGNVTPYAGGFVADPGVNVRDWVDSFGNTSDLPTIVPWIDRQGLQTEFVQGTGTSLNVGNTIGHELEILKLSDGDLGGEAADGVAYMGKNWKFTENGSQIDVPRHHAGILSGTYLGAPLEVKPAVNGTDATADWAGKLGMIVNGASPVESSITLEVNYTDQNITLSRTAIGLGAVSFTNVGWDNTSGVLTGAITYDPNDSALADSEGKVTGLIGQQGAVGAFISNHDNPISNASYAGGFVAVPPSE